jgi:integrase
VFRVQDARHFVFSNDKDCRRHDGGRRPHANRLAGHASFSKEVARAKDRHDRFIATLIYDHELHTSSLDIHDAICGVALREDDLLFAELRNLSRDSGRLDASRELCPEYFPLFLAALRAGLRRGEVIALKWGDIQFGAGEDDANRYILVERNYVKGRFTTPKSNKSRRVDLSRQLRNALLELRDKRLLEAFLQGKTTIADDLIFLSKTGTVLDASNLIHYYFLPCIEKAGLRHFRFHDLRHTFGSLLIQQGASLTYVKDQMGHSSIQVTVDTYGHLIPGADVAWIDKLDAPTSPQPSATPVQPDTIEESDETSEVIENIGEPGRTRTCNPLIKRSFTPFFLTSFITITSASTFSN